ncbi:A/G-specific adenine glycosylase [Occultella glacieicola]|uniref:Adenine DNA glycosylase n=1 Tax=Occultella glacieicola TaxID=2518684 RepID=A0ABY2E3B1_9MICO|nr:A/G-specific adenine glycosylase [Occultella glacieicola]TDE91684.1 A/G-specific adenine glycosylase [Occultella glacieicola]
MTTPVDLGDVAAHGAAPIRTRRHVPGSSASDLHTALLDWFAAEARDLPWRDPATGAWGVLVSEIMLQQTPVARVEPRWRDWMARWPSPADLAAASPADVLRAWDRLGYPRRALRLREAAAAISRDHGGLVPTGMADLLALPGVGTYTAAAVTAFAYRRRAVVLDTNVRRVLARLVGGRALPPPTQVVAESERARALLPDGDEESARWNAALMELGALVCTARAPSCSACPVRTECAWLLAGRPADAHASNRRTQAWHGTDRQARGRILAMVRQATGPVTPTDLARAWEPGPQYERALAGLLTDGLVAATTAPDGVVLGYALPLT